MPLYNPFDQAIGITNIGINNGTIHINDLKSADDTHRYYSYDNYSSQNIIYDGQPYYNLPIKYDLLNDAVVAKPQGEKSLIGINLIADKTQQFTLDGKKFINLRLLMLKNIGLSVPDFISGFYEEDVAGKLKLYTKYQKNISKVLRNDGVYYHYEPSVDFLFGNDNNAYKLSSQKDLRAVYPTLEKNIRDFYDKYSILEKSDKKTFYLKLLNEIDNLLQTTKIK